MKTTGQLFSVGVGDEYIGRVLNALGDPVDGGKELKAQQFFPVEKVAPGVITRKSVDQPLQTGIKAVDALVPIGLLEIDRLVKLPLRLIPSSTKSEKM